MNEYKIKKRILLGSKAQSNSNCVHIVNGKRAKIPYELLIVIYPNVEGYYLLYIDNNGNEITDTYHDTLGEAMKQAEWEFDVSSVDWIDEI